MRRTGKRLFIFLIISVYVFFNSCSNFLDGSDFMPSLQNDLSYANADSSVIYFSSDDPSGSFFLPDDKVFKTGYPVQVEFSLYSDDFKFMGLEAVSYVRNEESRRDFVEIKKVESFDEKYGVYKFSITLLKPADDILIRPVSYLINMNNDKDAPFFSSLNVSKSGENNDESVSLNLFSDYASKGNIPENISEHHAGKSIWISYSADDRLTGVERVYINEQLVYRTNGTAAEGSVYEKVYEKLSSNSDKLISDSFEYVFSSPEDGVIRLTVCAVDMAGNLCSKSFDLIKDTLCGANFVYSDSEFSEMYVEDILNSDGTYDYSLNVELRGMATAVYATDFNRNEYFDNMKLDGSSLFIKSIKLTSDLESGVYKTVDFIPSFKEQQSSFGLYPCEIVNLELKRKPYEDVFVLVEIQDAAGNVKLQTINLNKSITIKSSITDENGNLILLFEQPVPEGNVNRELHFGYNGYDYMEKIESYEFINSASIKIKDFADKSDGVYYFSLRAGQNTCFGNRFKYNKNVSSGENILVPEQSDIPNFEIIADPPVLNSAKRTVHVNYLSDLDDDYSYIVNYYHDQNLFPSVSGYSSLDSFEVESHLCEYSFKIIVMNKNGDRVESDPVTLDLSYDNIRPEFKIEKFSILTGKIVILDKPVDIGSTGLVTTDDGQFVIIKCLASNDKYLKNIDWNDERVKVIRWNPDGDVEIPLDSNIEKYWYFMVQDKNGNSLTNELVLDYFNPTESINVEPNGSYVGLNYSTELDPNFYYSDKNFFLSAQYLTGNVWKYCSQTKLSDLHDDNHYDYLSKNTYKNCYKESQLYYLTYELIPYSEILDGETYAEKDSFVKVCLFNTTSVTDPDNILFVSGHFSDSVYVYLPSLREKIELRLKDFITGNFGVSVFTDKPCFVHTLYGSLNLGNDIQAWLNMGIEAKVQMEDSSFTYIEPEIPAGKYYTTIIHYADGTMAMTDVKKKAK